MHSYNTLLLILAENEKQNRFFLSISISEWVYVYFQERFTIGQKYDHVIKYDLYT